jgi:hypothetical protein
VVSDEKLIAYAKGELSPEEAHEIEGHLWREPELAARLEKLRARLGGRRFEMGKLAGVASAAGARLGALLAPLRGHQPAYLRWALMAAALALGILIGRLSEPAGLIRAEAGQLRAGPALAHVLDRRIAATPQNLHAELRVGESLQSLDGFYCRTFSSGARGAVSGLACREDAGWIVRVAASGLPPQGEFAGARIEAPIVMQMRDALIVGDPLDDDGERAARRNGWRLQR